MKPAEMNKLIEIHLAAEKAADPAGAISVYTDDVEHDVVGYPTGPVQGKGPAKGFYDDLTQSIHTEEMKATHSYYGEDFCVIEHMWTGTVPGNFLGVPGHGKRISHRLLHVWEFRDGRISRENVWIDSGSAIAQLTASTGRASTARANS